MARAPTPQRPQIAMPLSLRLFACIEFGWAALAAARNPQLAHVFPPLGARTCSNIVVTIKACQTSHILPSWTSNA